jgi:hypothetical protein
MTQNIYDQPSRIGWLAQAGRYIIHSFPTPQEATVAVASQDQGPIAPTAHLAEFAPVTLRRLVYHGGVVFPAGTHGIVVHIHDGGAAYEVEFSHPAEMVLTLTTADLV